MPTACPENRPTVGQCAFPLWSGVPESWLRNHGRTRVLVVDDQLKRQDLLSEQLQDWLNIEIDFLGLPQDYRYDATDIVPRGTFDSGWFQKALDEALKDPRPIAAVLLDLLYGSEQRINDASGPKFLSLLRRRLPDVPVLILSNVEETLDVRGVIKEGGGASGGDVSFQDYLPKRITNGAGLTDRLTEKLIAWGDLSDPALCAFSPAMRRLARQMRRIVLFPQVICYQEQNANFSKPVVIKGVVGSGKNYVANHLRAISDRRDSPYLRADFSGHEIQDFTATLFGTMPFSGGPQWFRVRPSDAAVLEVMPAGVKAPANGLYLGSLGLLHRAHIAEQPAGQNQAALRGTLLIDEIGTAPELMQTRLLSVFNYGRFTPHLGSYEIPAEGALDVWFLITLSPEGQVKLRDDLATRLEAGHWLDVPPLSDRKEDMIPLTLQALGAVGEDEPARFFTKEALNELGSFSDTLQVRGLINSIKRLAGFTDKLPYSGAELKQSSCTFEPEKQPRSCTTSVSASTAGVELEGSDATTTVQPGSAPSSLSQEDALRILQAWCDARGTEFPAILRDQDQLRGKGNKVVGGAAAAILSFLELCMQAQAVSNRYSATRTWNFFAGVQGTKAPDARTRIAPLFLIEEAVSLDMLRRSDALLWLALDVSSRRSEVRALIERLRPENGQAARIDRIGSASEDLDQ